MRKLIIGLVVSLSLIFTLSGCAVPADATGVVKLGDMRIVTDEASAIGLTILEVVKRFGPALTIDVAGCTVPLIYSGEDLGKAEGDQLNYGVTSGNKTVVKRSICILKGIAVADRLFIGITEGNLITIHTLETIDPGLAGSIMLGKEERKDVPQYNKDLVIPYGRRIEV